MRILIEEYQYAYDDVKDIIKGLVETHDSEGKVSLPMVGYYFNPSSEVQDCVFILPKVLLEGKFGEEKVFGHIAPEQLIHADQCKELKPEEANFIYNLSVWIYRAICVFKKNEYKRTGGKKDQPSIVLHKQVQSVGGNAKRKQSITFLDVLLALQCWNKENEQFVTFILKNLHSGYNKINWTRTISKSAAFLQTFGTGGANQDVTYINPVNKKRQINFDEDLLIIYYSILQYMKDAYGFPVKLNVNFPLIKGRKFEKYLNGYGLRRLKQIKYKYFSDKALELWNLCHDFFARPKVSDLKVDNREYLLVKSFHIVFEAIIDELIAGDQQLPTELLDQPDGKRVDHMYQYQELTNNDRDDRIYYIGDSKYYKRGNNLGTESIYKQFTYARNVIQWNIDLFNDGKPEAQAGHIKLRDDETEGYNIIPNFFISANQNVLKPEDDIQLTQGREQYHLSRQFENRLFDRDTFLLAHYDVNFLFVVALYGHNNQSSKVAWRTKVRKMFRKGIQEALKERFEFYAMTAHADVAPENYIKEHFQMVLGKVYHPFDGREGSDQQYYSLALRKPESVKDNDALKARLQEENEQVLFELKESFFVAKCELGQDPRTLPEDVMPKVEPLKHKVTPKNLLTMHHLENYLDTPILVGCYKGMEHLHWIFGRNGGKRDDAYNVRLGKAISGAVVKSRDNVKHAKFVVLYDITHEVGITFTFRVKNIGEMTKEKMQETDYANPRSNYLCYFFDEEITLGDFDIEAIIKEDSSKPDYVEGRPIYLTGKELIKYRK